MFLYLEFIFLNVLDALLTQGILERVYGVEANPIINNLITNYGFISLYLLKIIGVTIIIYMATLMPNKSARILVMMIINSIYIFIIVNNLMAVL
jgi:hypothetical protein